MNVILSNKNSFIINSINVDIIKKLDGEYSIDEIISTFKNFYFQRMIIDIMKLFQQDYFYSSAHGKKITSQTSVDKIAGKKQA